MKLLSICIAEYSGKIKKLVCEASTEGSIAANYISQLLFELNNEPQLEINNIYYARRAQINFYLQTDGLYLYVISFDQKPEHQEYERHFQELKEIVLLEAYNELYKKIADPNYIASKVKRLQNEMQFTKEQLLSNIDKLVLREQQISELVEKTSYLEAESRQFSMWLKNMRQKRQKNTSFSDKINHMFFLFFSKIKPEDPLEQNKTHDPKFGS